jgi:hypothetical protein
MANNQIPYWFGRITPVDRSRLDELVKNPWHTTVLGGFRLVGISSPRIRRGHKLDVKPSQGTSGATITRHGWKPGEVTIDWTIWTANHWDQAQIIIASFEAATTQDYQSAQMLTIEHPSCSLRNIDRVVIEDITGPDPSPKVRGAMMFVLKCVEGYKVKASNETTTLTAKPVQIGTNVNQLSVLAPKPSSQAGHVPPP